MKILVANFGSTSFKYRLFDMDGQGFRLLAKGGYERVTDYAAAVESMAAELAACGALPSMGELDAVGFKAVQGGDVSGCREADGKVLEALERFMDLAPAHNRPYADGIRLFADRYPNVRRAVLFETAFYQWVPDSASCYALPAAWRDAGIRRYGFHGASHKYVNERVCARMERIDVADRLQSLYAAGPGEFDGAPFRVVTCHLGGSSSVTATRNGLALGTSMGLSPQSGLPQSNRVGDLDSAAIPYAMRTLGISMEEAERHLTRESGLLGLSDGLSLDVRDLREAAGTGHEGAARALDAFAHAIRFYIGALYAELGGLDALVFTGGIGENDAALRSAVCDPLGHLGLTLDPERNRSGDGERQISPDNDSAAVWILPTDEEQIVAREVYRLFEGEGRNDLKNEVMEDPGGLAAGSI